MLSIKYDDNFAFCQPVVTEWQKRSKCLCSEEHDWKMVTAPQKVAFLKCKLPKYGQTLSQAIALEQEYGQNAECIKPLDQKKGGTVRKEDVEVDKEGKVVKITSRCYTNVDLSNRIDIEEASDILFVLVERNVTNPEGVSRVSYREILDEEISIKCKGQDIKYDLIGGLLHSGGQILHGHYVAIVKLPEVGKCVMVNDHNPLRFTNRLGQCKMFAFEKRKTQAAMPVVQKATTATNEQTSKSERVEAPEEAKVTSIDEAAGNLITYIIY